jgi:hypothetical protein
MSMSSNRKASFVFGIFMIIPKVRVHYVKLAHLKCENSWEV